MRIKDQYLIVSDHTQQLSATYGMVLLKVVSSQAGASGLLQQLHGNLVFITSTASNVTYLFPA